MFKPITGLTKIKFLPRKQTSSDSGSQLADDCCEALGGKFMFYRSVIKKVGEQIVREWFSDSKISKNRVARFMWLYKDFMSKVIWTKLK